MFFVGRFGTCTGGLVLLALLAGGTPGAVLAQGPTGKVKGQSLRELMSGAGFTALSRVRAGTGVTAKALPPDEGEEEGDEGRGIPRDNVAEAEPEADQAPFGGGGASSPGGGPNPHFKNVFVNDPCLDPSPRKQFPKNFFGTVQSETEIGVLNDAGEHDTASADGGRLMVAGYNDSRGFDNNLQGLSGFSYSTDGGESWIDGGGLPPRVPSGAPAGSPGSDAYFGDPVVAVHHHSKTFYYASIYLNARGVFTLSVNRGTFRIAPRQVPVESNANTRCKGNNSAFEVPDPPGFVRERIIWGPPVQAVKPVRNGPGPDDDDFLDKEWLYVDQNTGYLYLTYTRFAGDGSTPLELVRSFDGGKTWTEPAVIVPNLLDTFNQGTQAVVTPTGRVIVSYLARTFPAPEFVEREHRVEIAYSDNCSTQGSPCDFSKPVIVSRVNPEGEPPGYNRGRLSFLNAPFVTVDKGRDDGTFTDAERHQPGFGTVYLTYFSGITPFAKSGEPTTVFRRAGNIYLSRSVTDGKLWQPRVKVNDDKTRTSHIFSSVQVNRHGLVFVSWIDRRFDGARNLLSDTFGDISHDGGKSFEGNVRISNVSTDWIVRADARPNFGDYNSSEVINFDTFVSIWADGRFPKPGPLTPTDSGGFTRSAEKAATPDAIFQIFQHSDDAK